MADHICDVAVIGAGTAGIAAERNARRHGAATLLIDPEFIGTTCASVGCMPSKLLIAAAENAYAAAQSDIFGIRTGDIAIDGKAVMQRLREERDKFTAGTRSRFEKLPRGTTIRARARFTAPTTLALDNGDTVSAKAVVIATGSSPMVPEPFAALGNDVLTSDTIFEIEDLPRSLAVIGGGTIGLELAQAMARLGVEVSLFDRAETLGKVQDQEILDALLDVLTRDMNVHLGVDVTPEKAAGGINISWKGKSTGHQLFEKVLVAVGRPPNLKDLDLAAAGVELDDRGRPLFDRTTMQCGEAPIFIAGDDNADAPLLHEAATEGAIAGRNAVAYPASIPSRRTPSFAITFTDPPLVLLGQEPGENTLTGFASYTDQGRAKVEARADGCIRLYAEPEEGVLTGAAMFAPGADHMAHLLMLAIMKRVSASQLLEMPFYHPTLEEGLRPALRDICGATPTPIPGDRDGREPPGG
ncbi:dihydrolipoyl dehydrogenase [Altericroceibacterium spongiae]|uniref:Dihydrolipoyl dehydrogenase n=2 Tax=Altericroceibacterium spongiae TaxID=2320269 RepID=A0A420EC44_9SPHN|nr:dihydrolipoyl dehydrogenase [Altericroceibacterium spongiae]